MPPTPGTVVLFGTADKLVNMGLVLFRVDNPGSIGPQKGEMGKGLPWN
jgi:hypothetical protein